MRCSNTFSFVVFAVLSVLLAACVTERTEPGPEAVKEPEEVPVMLTYRFSGTTLEIEASETSAVVRFPSGASREELGAFISQEAARYPEAFGSLTYKLYDNTVALTYASGLDERGLRAFATILANDAYEASGAVGALSVEHRTGDGSILLVIDEGGATVSGYSDYLSDEALGYVIAAGNAEYASVLGGVSFKANGDGTMSLSYPGSVSKADVASFAQLVLTGLRQE